MARYTPADFDQPTAAPASIHDLYADSLRVLSGEDTLPTESPAALPPSAVPAPPAVAARRGPVYWLTFAGAAILLALAVFAVLRAVLATPAPSPMPSPAATPARSTVVATAPPLPTARPPLAPGLAVYWAPAGDLAPSLPATTIYTPTARFHKDWVQLVVAGYQQAVWARADVVPGANVAALPDLAPSPTATPAPQVIVQQVRVEVPVPFECTPERAQYAKDGPVTSATGAPLGSASAWSCTSQAEADQRWEQLAAQVRTKAGGH